MAQLNLYMIELIQKIIISVYNYCIDQKGVYELLYNLFGLVKVTFSHFFLG